MPASSKATLDTKVLDAIIKHLDGNVADAIAKIGFAVEGRAKINIQQMEAIDTGALLNSGYTSLARGSRQAEAFAEARSRRPDVQLGALPTPQNDATAYVGFPVEYAAEVHFGNAYMAGRPFLVQAVRETEADFRKMLGDAVVNK